MKATKQSKPLPNPQAVQELAQGPKKLSDYSKITPISNSSPNVIENLRNMGKP